MDSPKTGRLLKAGIDIAQVAKLTAHTDEKVTGEYKANHEPDYVDLGLIVNKAAIGGEL